MASSVPTREAPTNASTRDDVVIPQVHTHRHEMPNDMHIVSKLVVRIALCTSGGPLLPNHL